MCACLFAIVRAAAMQFLWRGAHYRICSRRDCRDTCYNGVLGKKEIGQGATIIQCPRPFRNIIQRRLLPKFHYYPEIPTFSRQSSGILFTVVSKSAVGVYLLAVRVSSSCRRIDTFYSQPQAVLTEGITDRILYAVFIDDIAFQTYYAKYVCLSRY